MIDDIDPDVLITGPRRVASGRSGWTRARRTSGTEVAHVRGDQGPRTPRGTGYSGLHTDENRGAMGRPAKFSEDQILDATMRVVATEGVRAATMARIAAAAGAPVGSLYHRFRSRELLLARLWVRTVSHFQDGFVAALAADDIDRAATGAALHGVRWARDHLDEARVLLLHRRRDLATAWPEELGDELAALQAQLQTAVGEHARQRYGTDDEKALQRLQLALVDLPYAAIRRYVGAGESPPESLDDLVVTACRTILDAA